MNEGSFQKARKKREKKQCPVQKTAAQKVLRCLSRQTVSAQVEQRVMEMLNRLIEEPEQIDRSFSASNHTGKTANPAATLEAALDEEMDRQLVDEDEAKSLIFQIASAKYEAIRAEEYETRRLRRIFAEHCTMQELDAELVQGVVRKIRSKHHQITIELKNGQILQSSL